MLWIAKDYEHPRHAVAEYRERVEVAGEWYWRAKTACGRTLTGISGGMAYPPDCKHCLRVFNKV